jgi:5-methylcytosine-specific restriction endonuclease McrA
MSAPNAHKFKKAGLIIEEDDIEELVKNLSNNFTAIISRDILRKYPKLLDWGDNGIGARWAKKKFNYTVVTNEKVKTYSENDDDEIDNEILNKYRLENTKMKGIIGIFVHSKRLNVVKRPIKKEIGTAIKKRSCVSCGSRSEIICDHKNDIYNDEDVLNTKTQVESDFQPLCNHCNLQKRQIFKDETKNNKIYSAKNLEKYVAFKFEFPWEKKVFDVNDINTKTDTYWYDPVEFNKKIFQYMMYVLPIVNEIKCKAKGSCK